MRFTAILDPRLWWPAQASTHPLEGLVARLRRADAASAPAAGGFAGAMAGLAPQDPVLLAEWLHAEDLLVKPPLKKAPAPGSPAERWAP